MRVGGSAPKARPHREGTSRPVTDGEVLDETALGERGVGGPRGDAVFSFAILRSECERSDGDRPESKVTKSDNRTEQTCRSALAVTRWTGQIWPSSVHSPVMISR